MGTGVLPELDALGALLEANEEWQDDASAVRARMLGILLEVADRYVSLGGMSCQTTHARACCMTHWNTLEKLPYTVLFVCHENESKVQLLDKCLKIPLMGMLPGKGLSIAQLSDVQGSLPAHVLCLRQPCASMRRSWG